MGRHVLLVKTLPILANPNLLILKYIARQKLTWIGKFHRWTATGLLLAMQNLLSTTLLAAIRDSYQGLDFSELFGGLSFYWSYIMRLDMFTIKKLMGFSDLTLFRIISSGFSFQQSRWME